MKIAMISFTRNGRNLEKTIAEKLNEAGHEVRWGVKCKELMHDQNAITCSAKEWTKEQFKDQDVLIFIGAVQITVRLIACYIESKITDPAVLVVDEKGRYCIPVLSGHIGGANEMAEEISRMMGAVPVITTATDINQKWAVDVFAKKNHLYIEDMQKAKQISADVLEGRQIKVSIEGGIKQVEGVLPEELEIVSETYENPDIYIGIYKNQQQKKALRLVPQIVTVGIGCKKGISSVQIESLVDKILKESHINKASVGKIASIDLKKNEEGLLAFCSKYNIEPEFYPAEELKQVKGEFSASAFVKSITGVDNVCERSAAHAGGTLRIRKRAENGVTAAFAWNNWRIEFE